MEGDKLILSEQISSLVPLKQPEKMNLDGASEEEKKQLAKDFESLLLNKLLDEMKNTIGEWGFEKDGASTQVQGIFWMYLARDIANNGGIGLWKEIYQTLTDADGVNPAGSSMDRHL
jgi:Rod binding domain-containing protein